MDYRSSLARAAFGPAGPSASEKMRHRRAGGKMQPLPSTYNSSQNRRSHGASAVLGFVFVSLAAYWLAVGAIYGFKSLHPHGLVDTKSPMARHDYSAPFQDPVFNALPTEMKRYVATAMD